jgi:hypothetical protein
VGQEGVRPPEEALDNRSNFVTYDIQAELDNEAKYLRGSETITWTNRSGEVATELWFHTYLNAFSNNRSTHMIESGGKLRDTKVTDEWGWQWVRELRVDGKSVMESFRYRLPDTEASAPESAVQNDDRTVFSVALPKPVKNGETVTIDLIWESQLPRVRRRTGYKDDFYLNAQWFPKLGVLEGGKWNSHEFHRSTEFYSDYGYYRVRLNLPAEYRGEDGKLKVGGSGRLTDLGIQEIGRDRIEVYFEAPSQADRVTEDHLGHMPMVHDFTWTADPDYVVHTDTFRFAEWAAEFPEEVAIARAAFGPDVEIELRDVDVTLLIQPERVEQAARHVRATEAALFFYGLWFGEYPYEHLTVIDPAWGGRAAGGMEYPTLFTCGTKLGTTPDMYVPESVTVHECGHQFWYGLVGNNEFETSWLDEGFNSYTDSEVLWRVYGPQRKTTEYSRIAVDGRRMTKVPAGAKLADWALGRRWEIDGYPALKPLRSSAFLDLWRDQPWLTFQTAKDDPRWSDRGSYLRQPQGDPVDKHAWEYRDGATYRVNSYPRTAVLLRTLKGVVGNDVFLRGMRHYAKTWRNRHPYPDDFFAAFQEGAGVDCQWFLEDAFRSVKEADWGVSVSQSRASKPAGWFQEGTGPFQELAEDDEDGEEDVVHAGEGEEQTSEEVAHDPAVEEDEDEDEDDAEPKQPWEVSILLSRKEEFCIPLTLAVTFDDGETETYYWTRAEQLEQNWKRWSFESERKVESVVLDPDSTIWIDGDMSDNAWYAKKDEITALRWSERVLSQWEHTLLWYMSVGG